MDTSKQEKVLLAIEHFGILSSLIPFHFRLIIYNLEVQQWEREREGLPEGKNWWLKNKILSFF
jgi:hypothetical protein